MTILLTHDTNWQPLIGPLHSPHTFKYNPTFHATPSNTPLPLQLPRSNRAPNHATNLRASLDLHSHHLKKIYFYPHITSTPATHIPSIVQKAPHLLPTCSWGETQTPTILTFTPPLTPPLPTFPHDLPLKFPLQQSLYINGSIFEENKHTKVGYKVYVAYNNTQLALRLPEWQNILRLELMTLHKATSLQHPHLTTYVFTNTLSQYTS